MSKPKLGVNIDHVATIRNARGENYPSPLRAAQLAQKFGAHSITIHLREDRRHINDNDFFEINKKIKIPLNLEMAPTNEMLKISIKHKPDYICLVPEKRSEVTTEGGLNLKKKINLIKRIINNLKFKKIRTSLFIEPRISDIKIAKIINADCVEIHTGKICNLYNKKKNIKKEFSRLKKAVNYGNKIGLEVHVGHGITFETAKIISKIPGIKEYNIGHFIIGESIFLGMKKTIGKFKKIISK